jgi:subtilisin family serine protease
MPSSLAKACRSDLLAKLLVVLATVCLLGRWDAPPPVASRGHAAEEATPESTPTEVTAQPAVQRARHLDHLGAAAWHRAGYRGQGITVAILDSGFRGYKAFFGKGLPEHVGVRSFRVDHNLEARDSQHGVLCAEVVHALAPEARILLANWEPDSPQSFLQAVHWARQQGAQIISCSLIMPSWSDGEGGGPIHGALAALVGAGNSAGDLLFFACAGNTAQRHWSGAFQPDADGFHQWAPGKIRNTLRPWGADRVAVELYGPIGSSYDLQVFDRDTGSLVGQASVRWGFMNSGEWRVASSEQEAAMHSPLAARHTPLGPGGCAVVRFLPQADHAYQIRLRGLPQTPAADKFHLVVLGGSLDWTTAHGSIPFPADGARIEAVGAVDRQGRRLFYSSCGPNSRLPKPDFVAPVPFASLCRDRAFAGTSAATPQAAGLAALWWCRNPGWSADKVRQAMRQAARDLGPRGHDWETGYGLIQLPEP